jgi:2-keto-4-pentenoate hydratase/2-oxohepta-3-ene-1,7-dioic acid hydratase in catechol pathway
MKIVRVQTATGARYGILDEVIVQLLPGLPWASLTPTGETVPLEATRLLAPVEPPNILAIGLNYRQHAAESQMKVPDHPLLFLKATTSVIGPDEPIVLPAAAPAEVDYEAELCLVIGRTARKVSEAEALDYVFGYTCGNDVSARDCQLRLDGQWARGKSFDTFCPLGPWIETELQPDDIYVRASVAGHILQDDTTAAMLFDCRALISFLSHQMTLPPGTVIMTGTPEGVGFARKPPIFLKAGDVVEVEVEGIGVLRNPVVAE